MFRERFRATPESGDGEERRGGFSDDGPKGFRTSGMFGVAREEIADIRERNSERLSASTARPIPIATRILG
jgi:hypothetical protein